ncbi:MAG: type II toxin-antitoxin system YafQ family toxin [Treponema sp.]
MLYKIATTNRFDKEYAKLNKDEKSLVDDIITKLSSDQKLPKKNKDHQLTGNLKDFRDCHVKNDLVLIYDKQKDILILTAYRINTHSEPGL